MTRMRAASSARTSTTSSARVPPRRRSQRTTSAGKSREMSGSRQLFSALFARGEAAGELRDAAWTRALLDFEVALARALARAGIVPAAAAESIAAVDPARI